MPHYADGTVAMVGDVVRGKGYNVKGPDGELREIVGTVVSIVPGSDSCNVKVAHVELHELPAGFTPPPYGVYRPAPGVCVVDRHGMGPVAAVIDVEYGQADHFTLVEPRLAE